MYFPAVLPTLLCEILPRLLLLWQCALGEHFIPACAPGLSYLIETSCSLCLLHSSSSSLSFLWSPPMTPSPITKVPSTLFSLVIGCSHFYLIGDFKLRNKVFTTKARVCGNSLVLGQPDLGVQNLAFEYTAAPNQPQ